MASLFLVQCMCFTTCTSCWQQQPQHCPDQLCQACNKGILATNFESMSELQLELKCCPRLNSCIIQDLTLKNATATVAEQAAMSRLWNPEGMWLHAGACARWESLAWAANC